jgi:hypothetical protein
VTYKFGGQECSCDARACLDCKGRVARFCSGAMNSSDDAATGTPADLAFTREDLGTPPATLSIGAPCTSNDQCTSGYCPSLLRVCTCNKPDLGYRCQTSSDCCNPGVCSGGVCTTMPQGCRPAGGACTMSAQCCVGLCRPGTGCACIAGLDLCNTNKDCCTGACRAPSSPTGFWYCAQHAVGESCVNAIDCSSNKCQNGICACAAKGYNACESNADCCSHTCDQHASLLGTCV